MKNSLFTGVSALLCFSASFTSALPFNFTAVGLVRRDSHKTDSGLTVSNVPTDWPDDATLNRVLASAPGKGFFWTGRNGGVSVEGKALLVAKSQGGNTLEGTLAAANLIMPDFDFNNPETIRIWTVASKAFANLASGETFLVTGRSTREGNVFHTEELPRLKANRKITKITKIDSTTARRTVVFDRNAGKLDAAANEANLRRDACLASPPRLTIPRRSDTFRRDLTSPPPTVQKRAAPAARSARRKGGAAPACPLPGATQTKKVVQRSNTSSKQPPERTFQAGGKKPAAKPPAAKRKVPRPANRPRRPPGKAAPPRKRITPVKKPKKAAKPASKPRGKPRKRR
ncbi:hypothetical protein B0H16DRAFT_1593916 [Mycena metata]|uniref:Uncharacterized protein n=1 Tax=Mycena metata TaxID=1033252 RepID=A0AAD7HRP2_9AGAR|nr:hypothetical protein B0H16DRAFT_1593916 [Mycena metata]